MKTVKKTLDILELFLNGKEEVGISELVEQTGQNISTIHDILHELMIRGYIRQENKRGKYSLGLKFLSFSGAINKYMAIQEIFHPYMVKLSEQINESVNLSVNNGTYATSIAHVYSHHDINVNIKEFESPLYCTSYGKVFLANLSDEELEKYFHSQEIVSLTPNTITDPVQIKKQLQKIRLEDVAFDDQEFHLGVRSIASPIRDYYGKVIAVISVFGPAFRITKKKAKEYAPIARKFALNISSATGYLKNT